MGETPGPRRLPQALWKENMVLHGQRGTNTGVKGVGDACLALLEGVRLAGARVCTSGECGRVGC